MITNFSIKEMFKNCRDDEILLAIQDASISSNLLRLFEIVQAIRSTANVPFIVTSAYRDHNHNLSAGGSSSSQHRFGQAVDIKCSDYDKLMFGIYNAKVDGIPVIRLLGQVITYYDLFDGIIFFHIALPCEKHPSFEMWMHKDNYYKRV